jgi:hypothetical protein
LPTTHASCPGGIRTTSPGPEVASEPSAIFTPIRPEIWYRKWAAWQSSVPAIGLTSLDHFHPGCAVKRPTVPPPTFTTSIWPCSNFLVSSGAFRLFFSALAIAGSFLSCVTFAGMMQGPR